MMKMNKILKNIVFTIGMGIFAGAHVDVAVAMKKNKVLNPIDKSRGLRSSIKQKNDSDIFLNTKEKGSSMRRLSSRRDLTKIKNLEENVFVAEEEKNKKSKPSSKKSNALKFPGGDKKSNSEFTSQKRSKESISSEDSLQSNLTEIFSVDSGPTSEESVSEFKARTNELTPIKDNSEGQSGTDLSNNITPKKTDKSSKKSPSKAVLKGNEEDTPISLLKNNLESVEKVLSQYRMDRVLPKRSPQRGDRITTNSVLLDELTIQKHITSLEEIIGLIKNFSCRYQNCDVVITEKEEIEKKIGEIKTEIIKERQELEKDLQGKEGEREKLEKAIMTLRTSLIQVENIKLKIEKNLLQKNVDALADIKLAEELTSSEEAQEKNQITREDVQSIVQEACKEDQLKIESLQQELAKAKEEVEEMKRRFTVFDGFFEQRRIEIGQSALNNTSDTVITEDDTELLNMSFDDQSVSSSVSRLSSSRSVLDGGGMYVKKTELDKKLQNMATNSAKIVNKKAKVLLTAINGVDEQQKLILGVLSCMSKGKEEIEEKIQVIYDQRESLRSELLKLKDSSNCKKRK